MKTGSHVNVLVAGAGPAGSACSTLLARAGLSVLLCDKEQFPREKICGDCINPESWEFFELLGVADSLRHLDLHCVELARITNLSGKQVAVRIPIHPGRPFFSIKRGVLDNLLLQHAVQEGTQFLEQTQVLDAVFSDSWNVTVRGKNGVESYSCDYLVGADGRNSTVANKIGAWSQSNISKTNQRRVGIQWHADVQPLIGSEVRLYTMKEGYFGIVNVDERTSNIAMVSTPHVARNEIGNLSEYVEQRLYGNPVDRSEPSRLKPNHDIVTAYPINPIRRRWNHPKAFLAGDARLTVEPFTGEGVLFALDDGIRTARQIAGQFDHKRHAASQAKTDFWVNRVVSPTLRNQSLVESLVSIASEIKWLPRLFAKTVFHTSG